MGKSSNLGTLTILQYLSEIPGLGPARIKRLLERVGSLERTLHLPVDEIAQITRLKPSKLKAVWDLEKLADSRVFISEQLRLAKRHGAALLPIVAEQYPSSLAQTSVAPPILYLLGAISLLSDWRLDRAVGVVGTRNPSQGGQLAAQALGYNLAKSGWTVISGFAKGIDTEAHRGALHAGGITVAVLGCGVDIVYPSENRNLYTQIQGSGLLISEFPLGTHPDPIKLARRNKIVVGLSRGIVIVETGLKGGSWYVVRAAQEQKKPVFVVSPPNPALPQAEGILELLRSRKAEAVLPETAAERLEQVTDLHATLV